jgi:hypothetical protein
MVASLLAAAALLMTMAPRRPRVLLAALAVILLAAPARAQTDKLISLGVCASGYRGQTPEVGDHVDVGVLLRLNIGSGLGPAIGFQWHGTDVQGHLNGTPIPLGHLTVKPIMVGASYIRRYGRVTAAGSLVGGYAFSSIHMNVAQRVAAERQLGAFGVTPATGHLLAWRPSAALWYDLNGRFGLMASLGYMGMRPNITLSSSAGEQKFHVNASSVVWTLGMVYGIF